MRFQVTSHFEYEIPFPSTLILNIHAQRNSSQAILSEDFSIEPRVKSEEFVIDGSGNRFVRLETGRKKHLSISYEATVDCEHQVIAAHKIDYTPVAEMDRKAIPFLFPAGIANLIDWEDWHGISSARSPIRTRRSWRSPIGFMRT